MTLHKKDGMWISDWANKDSDDDQGCRKRQSEQAQKAFDLIGKMEKQGWKEIGFSGYGYQDVGLAKSTKILKQHSNQLKKAFKSHDADIKKKWGQKKVNMWSKTNASSYFLLGDHFFTDFKLDRFLGELPSCVALMNKGNEYRLITTYGSDDDEAGYWSKPVTQIAFKSTASKPKAKAPARKPAAKKPTTRKSKPKPKAPAKKPVAKPKAKTTSKARPSPSQSAAATKVGTRKRGNDGFMWEVKKSKNGVHRWVRDSKSTKRAEDYYEADYNYNPSKRCRCGNTKLTAKGQWHVMDGSSIVACWQCAFKR